MPSFHDLTAELVDLVGSKLDASSFCVFRLTSRECYAKSLYEYLIRLNDLRFLMAPHSLGALLTISMDNVLAPKIKVVRIGTHRLNRVPVHSLKEAHEQSRSARDREATYGRWYAFSNYLKAQDGFQQGGDTAMLTAIFSNLQNIGTIQIGECYDRNEDRFAPCYGQYTFEKETGHHYQANVVLDPDIPDYMSVNGLTHNFSAILRALEVT